VQTFPERGFGYVELPTNEAQKIKQKLNGMTLKGTKVKIEEARPEKRSKDKKRKSSADVDEDAAVQADDAKATKRAKRAKPEKGEGIITGHELDAERIVKRGWQDTVPKKRGSKKDEKASDNSLEGKSNLFKTSVPPNAVPLKSSKKESKSDAKKKSKETEKKTSKHDVVVKEFKNTTKILNTKSAKKSKPETHYEDGVGWVDDEGNVIEAEAPASRRKRAFLAVQPVSEPKVSQKKKEVANKEEVEKEASSESESDSEEEPTAETTTINVQQENPSERSSSEAPSITGTVTSIEVPISSDIVDPPTTPPTDPKSTKPLEREIHPLEALYKRPSSSTKANKAAETLAPIDTGFSFFGSSGGGDAGADRDSEDDEDDAEEPTVQHPPHTPHTKLDLEWRGTRSGAPTPDTAAIGKRFSFPLAADDDEDDEDEDDENGDDDETPKVDETSPSSRKISEKNPAATGEAGGEESEFRKWFYENRGELNRGWKKRRREEKKLKRQRESRRLGRKIA
jgi:hypothetical protein